MAGDAGIRGARCKTVLSLSNGTLSTRDYCVPSSPVYSYVVAVQFSFEKAESDHGEMQSFPLVVKWVSHMI